MLNIYWADWTIGPHAHSSGDASTNCSAGSAGEAPWNWKFSSVAQYLLDASPTVCGLAQLHFVSSTNPYKNYRNQCLYDTAVYTDAAKASNRKAQRVLISVSNIMFWSLNNSGRHLNIYTGMNSGPRYHGDQMRSTELSSWRLILFSNLFEWCTNHSMGNKMH